MEYWNESKEMDLVGLEMKKSCKTEVLVLEVTSRETHMCANMKALSLCSMYIVPVGKTFGRIHGTELQQPHLSWGVESGMICFPLADKIRDV